MVDKAQPMVEGHIQNRILQWLNEQPSCRAVNNHGSNYSGAGEPDVLCCWHGRLVAIEVKVPGEKPRPLQEWCLQQWAEAGALAFVACSLDDVKERLSDLLQPL